LLIFLNGTKPHNINRTKGNLDMLHGSVKKLKFIQKPVFSRSFSRQTSRIFHICPGEEAKPSVKKKDAFLIKYSALLLTNQFKMN